jgi:hypothetical protein
MSRFHVHVGVANLHESVRFYSTLFGSEPSVLKDDYAKWMLEEPRVNFAISARANGAEGVDHLGIQVETDAELRTLAGRLKDAGETTRDQEATTCCYAKGNKSWVNDPAGVRWETFFTFGEATTCGEDEPAAAMKPATGCGTKTTNCCA